MSTQTIAYLTAAFCILVLLIVFYCWLEAERILNWHIRRFYSQPRAKPCPVKRSTIHRLFLSLFIIPISE